MAATNPIETFLLEAEDLLSSIEEVTLEMTEGRSGADSVNHLFRAFHTLKGSGAMFGFDDIARFTHHVETTLDLVRNGGLPVTATLLECVLAAKDLIKSMVQSRDGGPVVPEASCQSLIARFVALGGIAAAESKPSLPSSGGLTLFGPSRYVISFRPDPGILARGTNVGALLDELRALGRCDVRAKLDRVPGLEDLDPELCLVRWEIELVADVEPARIRDVFMFVEDGSDLRIESSPSESVAAGPAVVDRATASTGAPPALETVPTDDGAGPRDAGKRGNKPSAKDATIRVTSERLDHLVNVVGELVMTQSRLQQVAARFDAADLTLSVEQIERLVNELRDNVLGIRMMPIGSTFGRFKRLVHDLSAELGKDVDLVTEGAETEIDKTVLDQLADPLIHLIRNSLDHGIETKDVRRQRGKAERGTIRLIAMHTGSNVVIRIQDDGKGLDREAILRKGIERGLVAPGTELAERDLFNLIFLPGFSTAAKVTSVSGRGVGMDVVKRQIEGLRGSVELASELGRGTTVTCTLPLTLAIVDGLAVAVGDDQFVIPTSAVLENVELPASERDGFNNRQVVAVRGQLIPYVRLRSVCDMRSEPPSVEKVVIVRHGDQRVGIVVDRVLGSHQTVIQPLGRFCRGIEMLSGSTIMGDGRVALILDIAGLVRQAGNKTGTRAA